MNQKLYAALLLLFTCWPIVNSVEEIRRGTVRGLGENCQNCPISSSKVISCTCHATSSTTTPCSSHTNNTSTCICGDGYAFSQTSNIHCRGMMYNNFIICKISVLTCCTKIKWLFVLLKFPISDFKIWNKS